MVVNLQFAQDTDKVHQGSSQYETYPKICSGLNMYYHLLCWILLNSKKIKRCMPKHFFMNPTDFSTFVKTTNSETHLAKTEASAKHIGTTPAVKKVNAAIRGGPPYQLQMEF